MTVRELIDLLESYDPDAEVRLLEQPSWPFEYSVRGVTARADVERLDEDGYLRPPEEQPAGDPDKPADTVFILEGTQLCYGDKEAWR